MKFLILLWSDPIYTLGILAVGPFGRIDFLPTEEFGGNIFLQADPLFRKSSSKKFGCLLRRYLLWGPLL